jgi:magnesium chelatase family protein
VKFEKLETPSEENESSESIRKKVQAARNLQHERFVKLRISANSEMSSEATKKFCVVEGKTKDLLQQAVTHFQLSARAYYRILKLSRTIADLAGEEKISTNHVAEALQYRPKIGEN